MFLTPWSIDSTYTVEIAPQNSAAATQFPFPDIPDLRQKKVVAIALSTAVYGVNTGKFNLGYLVASGATAYPKAGFVTLQDKDGVNFVQNMPLIELVANKMEVFAATSSLLQSNANGLVVFQPRIVSWDKCFVYFPAAPGLTNACIQFNIFYQF